MDDYANGASIRESARVRGVNKNSVTLFRRNARARILSELASETAQVFNYQLYDTKLTPNALMANYMPKMRLLPVRESAQRVFEFHLLPSSADRYVSYKAIEIEYLGPTITSKSFNRAISIRRVNDQGRPAISQIILDDFRGGFLGHIRKYRGVRFESGAEYLAEYLMFRQASGIDWRVHLNHIIGPF